MADFYFDVAEHEAMRALFEAAGDDSHEFTDADGNRMHATLGASSAERWINCSASVRLIKKAPRRPSSSYAQEGTAAHNLGEFSIKAGVPAIYFEGQYMTTRGELSDDEPELDPEDKENMAFEVDNDMHEAVQKYLDAIEEQADELRETYGVEPIRFLEKSFDLSRLYPGMFGSNDYGLFIVGAMLVVMDYKHGRGKVVEVKWNPQLLYYALGAIIAICRKKEHLPKIIRLVVAQPRAAHKDGPIRHADYTLEQVQGFAKDLVKAAKETERTDTIPVPGSWCQFCDANGVSCHAVREQARELVLTDDSFSDLTQEEEGLPAITTQQLIDRTLTLPGGLARALKLAPILDAYVRGIEAFAQHELENGRPILDERGEKTVKLVRKRANRRHRREARSSVEAKIAEGVVTFEEVFTVKLKSPAQLEKLKGLGKKFVATISEQPLGGITVADINDKRDEIEMNPFADLTDEDLMIGEADFTIMSVKPADDEWDIA